MNVEVKWRRVWQTRPYETEEIELRVGGDFVLPGQGDPRKVAEVATQAADLGRQLHAALSTMGDSIMVERLKIKDPRAASPVPAHIRR